MEMSAGNATLFHNLRDVIGGMEEVESTWLPIDQHPRTWMAKVPPLSFSWSLQRAAVARTSVRSHEKSGMKFDAAFFNTTQVSLFLRDFRKRVPAVDSMDMTPVLLARNGDYYQYRPRAGNVETFRNFKHNLTRRIFQEAAYLLPWSNWTKASLVDDYGISESKIKVLPPGINLEKWTRGQNVKARAKGRNLQILFVGGEFLRKGGDVLLRVAMQDEFKNFNFHFVTKSFEGPRPPNVFVYDNLGSNHRSLVELYEDADIFVLPTRADFFSIASLEAMAMEVPVITTNVGGIEDIIQNGKNGFMVQVNDEHAIVERLRQLVHSRILRKTLGRNGRKSIEVKFNLRKNARTIVEYLKLAAERKAA